MLVRAFIPAHITAFFFPRFHEDPLKAGSLGAGVNLDRGTNVFVVTEKGVKRHIRVAFNGKPVKKSTARISYSVAEEIIPPEFRGNVEIWQYFDFPNGHGFGNSAGGALGTALALAYAFKNKTLLQASQVAHKHEVINGGGLGDVIAQLHGGIEMRVKAGCPGIGIVDNIFFEDYRVLAIPFGRLSTKEILKGDIIRQIEVNGKQALERLKKKPTPENMMYLAREFAESTGLMEGELLEIARELDRVLRLPSSMVMLGKSIFALLREDEVSGVKEVLSDLSIEKYAICGIYNSRPEVGRWTG